MLIFTGNKDKLFASRVKKISKGEDMSTFKVVTGAMGSGKSAQAIITIHNLKLKGFNILVIKPNLDTRDNQNIKSRIIKDEIMADLIVNKQTNLLNYIDKKYDYIIVDESHMLTCEHISQLYTLSVDRNTNVILFGLRMSWKGTPFSSIQLALGYADEIQSIDMLDERGVPITHHIKLINGIPANIDEEDDDICIGDIDMKKESEDEVTFIPVNKQMFHDVYKYRIKR